MPNKVIINYILTFSNNRINNNKFATATATQLRKMRIA